jgi:hypothetical protein
MIRISEACRQHLRLFFSVTTLRKGKGISIDPKPCDRIRSTASHARPLFATGKALDFVQYPEFLMPDTGKKRRIIFSYLPLLLPDYP